MKRKVLLMLSIILAFGLCACSKDPPVAQTQEQLISIVREELGFQQEDGIAVTYAGEFSKGEDALLWFIIQDESEVYYRAVECKTLSGDRYRVTKIYTPQTYAKDIVSLLWQSDTIFLVNDTNCKTIMTEDSSGCLLSRISISEYPYIYHLDPLEGQTTTCFRDSWGTVIPAPAQPPLPKAAAWQKAYLQIIWNLPDYLADPFMAEGDRDEPALYDRENIDAYLGIHDFDEDGTPELIAGDGYALAVFTFADGQAEKLADLYYPGTIWCVNGVQFRDHSVSVTCSGSDGSDFVQFGYLDGEYKLGLYSQYHDPHDVFINGEISTLEEMNRIYPLDWNQRADSELREHFRMVHENGEWVLKSYETEDVIILDNSFDFDLIKWE